MSNPYLTLSKLEYDYAAQTEDELTVQEDQLVWILEDDDAEWYKVKIKTADSTGAIGLVPASYLTTPTPLRSVAALYAYSPSRNEAGELDNEEEMAVEEGERLILWEEEGDWVLVGRESGKGVGFVPSSYVEPILEQSEVIEERAATPPPRRASPSTFVPPRSAASSPASQKVATAPVKASDVKTWSVSELDKKKKKKKGTLGVGNGGVFFASESDKTPVQQYSLSTLVDITTEKSKHLHLTFPDSVELHFVISSKDSFDEIIAKIEEERSPPAAPSIAASVTSPRFVPPPLAATSSSSSTLLPPPPRRMPSITPPSPAASSPVRSSRPVPPPSNGDAEALYDFEAQGDDELNITEGDRLVVIEGGSDDADWIKCRKVGSVEEGVVPVSYVRRDEVEVSEGGQDDASEERRRAEAEAAADELALAEQIRADARAMTARGVEKERNQKRKDELARQKRLNMAPPVTTIPVPLPGDMRERSSGNRDREGKSSHGSSSNGRSAEVAKKPSSNRLRTWKDRTGQFKVEAEFLGMNGNKIRLHKLNGVIIEVPLEKMSSEDSAYLKKVTSRQNSGDDDLPLSQIVDREQRRDERHRRGQTAAASAGQQSSSSSNTRTTTSNRPSTSSKPAKPSTDWFDFFLTAGCDMDDCTRYARNFERDRIDEDLLVDLESATMRSLGLREGDIIRVKKLIEAKYQPPPTPNKSDKDARSAMEAAMSRSAAESTAAAPPPPSLFTSASGGLKTTRRGRPNVATRQGTLPIDSKTIEAASEELAKRGATPPIGMNRLASPPIASTASSSADPAHQFEDDAWTVKSAATKPVPVQVVPPPPPPPPPPVIIAPPTTAPASVPQLSLPIRSGSAGLPTTASTLSYNDGLLAQMGITNRPPSAPIPTTAPYAYSPSLYAPQQQQPSYAPVGPRGPVIPVASNNALLNPLIPTQTGMNFVPTRSPFGNQGGMMMPQMTGYNPSAMSNMMMPQNTGMPMMGQQAYNPMSNTFGLQPQQTGYANAVSPFGNQNAISPFGNGSAIPNRFNLQQPPPQQQQPIQFNPMPPPPQSAPPASTTTAQFTPSNVFAEMKGGFGGGNSGPQESNKYDALRSQPTGMPMQQPPSFLQPQQTGFPSMMMPPPPQQQQQQQGQQQFAQQTGYGYQGQQGRQY